MWSDDGSSRDSIVDLTDSPPPNEKKRKRQNSNVQSVSLQKTGSSQWVTSAFGDFDDFGKDVFSTQPVRTKQTKLKSKPLSQCIQRTEVYKKRPTYEDDLWSDKHCPKSSSDLAVHKKKIEEVQAWINSRLKSKVSVPQIALLKGPTGSGKSALVKVLAKEMKCDMKEWVNPLSSSYEEGNYIKDRNFSEISRVDDVFPSSQLSQFQQFLHRANKYSSLGIFGDCIKEHKIIVVEDFPNVFYRDAKAFHDVLRKYSKAARVPLIFIISDSTNGESNERLLFPKNVQEELNIENISFNPVAATTMQKILTKIAADEAAHGMHKFTIPSKAVIESIAMSSAGDIRGAINALQFACLKDTHDIQPLTSQGRKSKTQTSKSKGQKSKVKSSSKTSAESDSSLAAIGGRDTSLFLFRALGKILYCKRDDPKDHSDIPRLPPHLAEHERDPLIISPEEVIEKCHLSGDFFNAYLHQNYLEFFSEVSDVVRAAEYLSDSDFLMLDWTSRSALQQYAASVATRGLLHSNSIRSKFSSGGSGMGWKPLHKPQWYATSKMARQNCDSARCLFKNFGYTPDVLQTEIIPYLSVINVTLHDTGQISFINEITKFSNTKLRTEKLDEHDIDAEKDTQDSEKPTQSISMFQDEDSLPNSQSKVLTQPEEEEEEEYEITEYDD